MDLPILKEIQLDKAGDSLSNKRGIYFWFSNVDNSIVYIGIAVGQGGLRKRIHLQHLNPKYLEFRSEKQSTKDAFQLQYAISKVSKSSGTLVQGIDKSSFRKSIGRKLSLKPGVDTVEYIQNNFLLKVFESEDKSQIKEMEKVLIKQYKPLFNTALKLSIK